MKKENCEATIQILEDNLAQKSKDLQHQVMLNSLTLILGLIVGFIFAKTYKFVSFKSSK